MRGIYLHDYQRGLVFIKPDTIAKITVFKRESPYDPKTTIVCEFWEPTNWWFPGKEELTETVSYTVSESIEEILTLLKIWRTCNDARS